VSAVLLRVTRLDPLDGDPEPQPPDGEPGETVEAIGCGLATEPDDAQDLARQLVRLLEDPDERLKMGDRGRMAVIQAHTWGARAQELEHVCNAALAATRRTA